PLYKREGLQPPEARQYADDTVFAVGEGIASLRCGCEGIDGALAKLFEARDPLAALDVGRAAKVDHEEDRLDACFAHRVDCFLELRAEVVHQVDYRPRQHPQLAHVAWNTPQTVFAMGVSTFSAGRCGKSASMDRR